MNIMEVMKKENLGKEYTAEGIEFVLIESISSLWLENKETQEDIEDMFNLNEIIRMDFEEIVDVDWSKVQVDTKILVSEDGEDWYRRYFAKYENGSVHVFPDGRSSFTTEESDIIYPWKYAKLCEK